MARLLIAWLTSGESAWVKVRAEALAWEHGRDRIALSKAAQACLAEEVAPLEADLAAEA